MYLLDVIKLKRNPQVQHFNNNNNKKKKSKYIKIFRNKKPTMSPTIKLPSIAEFTNNISVTKLLNDDPPQQHPFGSSNTTLLPSVTIRPESSDSSKSLPPILLPALIPSNVSSSTHQLLPSGATSKETSPSPHTPKPNYAPSSVSISQQQQQLLPPPHASQQQQHCDSLPIQYSQHPAQHSYTLSGPPVNTVGTNQYNIQYQQSPSSLYTNNHQVAAPRSLLQQLPPRTTMTAPATTSVHYQYNQPPISSTQSSTTTKKKRPRRKANEMVRLYACNFQDCANSYGTLNHLNAHIQFKKHGLKRKPEEFKQIREMYRSEKNKKRLNASRNTVEVGATTTTTHGELVSGINQVSQSNYYPPVHYSTPSYITHHSISPHHSMTGYHMSTPQQHYNLYQQQQQQHNGPIHPTTATVYHQLPSNQTGGYDRSHISIRRS